MSAGRIDLISASAGSGKTYRLVDELEAAITRKHDPVRPEAVVGTTFTVKAAAELRERVRSRLLEVGRVEQAQRLGAARIGTVNSICAQLVTDFAFDLGISPEVQVLDEAAADDAFSRALSKVVARVRDDDEPSLEAGTNAAAEILEVAERFHDFQWLDDVRTIAERARANAIDAGQLRTCARRSVEALLRYFGPAAKDGDALERGLEKALAAFLAAPADGTKKTATVKEFVWQVHTKLQGRRPVTWWEWAKLASEEVAVASGDLYEPVRLAARGHEQHPGLREDVARCITLVFELAAQAVEAYEHYKREWGVIDFVDQEVMALRLLEKPEVRETLREQVDLVLVDEFQDTSPLQLAIFVALSRLAPRSVWVGDQKQAIYAFRGTDPALMDAAIAAIEQRGEQAHQSLRYSWRSRAELVRLTSDIFAPVFETRGIPADRVRLEPAGPIAERPDTMGPVVECWCLNTKNKPDDAVALAAAVRELLEDPGVRVRDVATDDERRVEARDVAILCRSNDECALVTDALEAAGIKAERERAGLMRTPEARLVLAALRLWVEPRQALAAAAVGRLLTHAGDVDEWLRTAVESRGHAFFDQEEVRRIAEASASRPLAGPLGAFDATIEAAGVREACLRWGREAQRLANLDALRALVHRYVATSETEGDGATVAGLIEYLVSLEGEKKDDQAAPGREDAITVSTLHGAKGLEWPVTVLHDIDSSREPSAFGVHVASGRPEFDFARPLADRWIRYWPDPYTPRADTALHDSVRGGPEHQEAARRSEGETLRLLYVGWTRARDRVVLTGRPGRVVGSTLQLLRDGQGRTLITEPAPTCVWAGRQVLIQMRSTTASASTPAAPEPGLGYEAAGPREWPAASADISKLPGTGQVGDVEMLGPTPFIQAPVEFITLGTAVHAFLAGDRPSLAADERLAMATGVLERWNVQGSLRPDALVAAADRLRAWVERRWPNAQWHREWPLRLRQADGTELAGYADLVLMNGDSFVLVDHKCISATRREALEAAAAYGGQIGAYAGAISKATGKRCEGCFVHLVAQAVILALRP